MVEVTCPDEKRRIAAEVLIDLPDSTAEYIRPCAAMPFFAARANVEDIGFIALKETSPLTAEICVMGVKKRWHRTGVETRKPFGTAP